MFYNMQVADSEGARKLNYKKLQKTAVQGLSRLYQIFNFFKISYFWAQFGHSNNKIFNIGH